MEEKFNEIIEESRKNYDISARYYMISREKWEQEIREDERRKWFEEKQRARAYKRQIAEQKRDNFIYSLPIRIVGLLMVTISITAVIVSEVHDASHCLGTIPLGLLMLKCPGYKNWNVK